MGQNNNIKRAETKTKERLYSNKLDLTTGSTRKRAAEDKTNEYNGFKVKAI